MNRDELFLLLDQNCIFCERAFRWCECRCPEFEGTEPEDEIVDCLSRWHAAMGETDQQLDVSARLFGAWWRAHERWAS